MEKSVLSRIANPSSEMSERITTILVDLRENHTYWNAERVIHGRNAYELCVNHNTEQSNEICSYFFFLFGFTISCLVFYRCKLKKKKTRTIIIPTVFDCSLKITKSSVLSQYIFTRIFQVTIVVGTTCTWITEVTIKRLLYRLTVTLNMFYNYSLCRVNYAIYVLAVVMEFRDCDVSTIF